MPPIGVIVNPHARTGKDPGLAARLSAVAQARGAASAVQIIVTDDCAALRLRMEALAAAGVRLIATCGGDGTTMAVVTEMVRAYGPERMPLLLLLRGGTVNTIARNLRISGRPEELLDQALCRLEGGEDALPRWPQDLLCVRPAGPSGDGQERYGCLFAAAMGARFLETYYGGGRPGLLPASWLMARTIASTMVPGGGALARRLFVDTEAELWVDGEQVPERRFRLLVASTVPDVGLGMRVAWRAGRSPGRLHLIASRLGIGEMFLQLHRVLRGEPLRGAPHLDRLVSRARLKFSAPQPYTLDGDLFRAEEVEIAVGPRIWVAGA